MWLEWEGVLPWCTEHGPGEKSMKCNACGVGDGFQSWAHHLVVKWLRRVILSLFSKEYWLQHDRCCVKHRILDSGLAHVATALKGFWLERQFFH